MGVFVCKRPFRFYCFMLICDQLRNNVGKHTSICTTVWNVSNVFSKGKCAVQLLKLTRANSCLLVTRGEKSQQLPRILPSMAISLLWTDIRCDLGRSEYLPVCACSISQSCLSRVIAGAKRLFLFFPSLKGHQLYSATAALDFMHGNCCKQPKQSLIQCLNSQNHKEHCWCDLT